MKPMNIEVRRDQLSYFDIKVITQYLETLKDLITLEKCNKRYRGLVEDINYNCIRLQNEKEYNILAKNKRLKTFLVVEPQELDEMMTYSNKPEEIVFRVYIKESQFNQYRTQINQYGCKCTNLKLIKENGEDQKVVNIINTDYVALGSRSYSKKQHIQQVMIGPEIEKIGREVFWGCFNLQRIYIPDSVTNIKKFTFERCSRLENVHLPSKLKVLPMGLFRECDNLKTLELPYGLERIERLCFGNGGLTSIDIPDTVTWIGSACFDDCENLVKVHLPTKITDLKSCTFWACCKLSEIIIPEGVKTINSFCFECCDHLTYVELPNTLTCISNGAFAGCEMLNNIQLPYGIKELRKGCFDCCGMEEIEIPETIEIKEEIFLSEDEIDEYYSDEEYEGKHNDIEEDEKSEKSESEIEDDKKDPNFRVFLGNLTFL